MPPARSGVAAYSADIVAALRSSHLVQVFVDEPIALAARRAGIDPGVIRSAHDFVWLHHQTPYDLTVYQLGNSSAHDFAWAYLFKYPGLAVLHDVHLHHARAASLMRQKRADDYRAEFRECHPDASPDVAELAVRGFDSHRYYEWPMTRRVVERSRLVAVHSPLAAASLRDTYPRATVERIRLGHGELLPPDVRRLMRDRVRQRLGIGAEAVVFGLFGGLTPEKRIPQVLAALETTRAYAPGVHLMLVGARASNYDVDRDVRERGLSDAVTITGYIDDDEFTSHLAAIDVSLNLRWPSAREVSGPWIRALAAGSATVTMDLWHTADVPGLDPRSWTIAHASPTRRAPDPVTVKIDVLDEDHSLRLAMRRLATDGELRDRLGAAGQAFWQAEHSHEGMRADYERVIALALASAPAKAKTEGSGASLRHAADHQLEPWPAALRASALRGRI